MSKPPFPAKEKVLIVDDLPANLRLLSQMLAEQGYGVRAVTSGARALASVEASAPDLILLDIRMPAMDGYTVCEQLKAQAGTREIPVVFISALGETEDKVRAFAVGGVDYVTKPFHVEEVLARVRTHLDLRRLQKQLQEANLRMEQELTLAGQVQASFLPGRSPGLPGWQVAFALLPARTTSGDFYDVHMLPNGRLAILIADVVDKGVGAALTMVLSWSLLRTAALEHPAAPALVFDVVNRRLLEDTHTGDFVTVFYGVLDPTTGLLVYGNAGHHPPYLLRGPAGRRFETLGGTGLPLGIQEEAAWQEGEVEIAPGDVLVLYTDGVADAQDIGGNFYGRQRLQAAMQAFLGTGARRQAPAQDLQEAILADVQRFVGDAPQVDDITLLVVARE
jgi:sigma-B regulation protein RsbU (phosphoserine phosphatase)